MTHDEALRFWFDRINYEMRSAMPGDLKLERMRALLDKLGRPQERLRIIHVAGTKGKGSTSAMVASLLRAAGYRVGLFTSPHLSDVSERIQVDGHPIGRDELAVQLDQIAPAVRELENAGIPGPTFFEIGTAIGLLHFVCRRVDYAIVEVGLGGRYDSTNVCRPLVTAITSIGIDHTAQLGNSLEEIAFQKAGIIKPNTPVVSAVTESGPREVILRVAREANAPVDLLGRDFTFTRLAEPERGSIQRWKLNLQGRRTRSGLELGLLGRHQAVNAATAVAIVDRLNRLGASVGDQAISSGLREVEWPARIEIVGQCPVVILDTAHNVPSVSALMETLIDSVHVRGKRSVLLAVSSDKQYPEMAKILAQGFDRFYLTKYLDNPRGVSLEKLESVVRAAAPGQDIVLGSTPEETFLRAYSETGPDDLLCVTGSVFLAGELHKLVHTTCDDAAKV